ncbi:ABC transporter ATP-binding protein [Xanthomonas albilineans]|uniref:ABC transporter ATP-binding protein n=2 Tax=Xanthomonas albilineans TaxID=29447 RepID=UPI0005F329DD|nr:ABC transporter ATP-binding protein [Xanthomonas albilineans]
MTAAQMDSTQRPRRSSTAPRGEVVARLTAVTKTFGKRVALDHVSLELHAGEVIALLGPNGAGKTTTVRLLLGLTEPTTGIVELFGGDPRSRAARKRVGAMLQVGLAAVPGHMHVSEHIELFRSYYDHPLPTAEVIRLAGLEGLEKRRFGKLSGGQQQRLMFALALCGDPDFLFLDEPTVGLDTQARRALWTHVRDFVARGKTVLLTTHYLAEADELANRILLLKGGRVIAEGTPEQIKARQGVRAIRCRTSLPLAEVERIAGVASASRIDDDLTAIFASEAEPVVLALMQRDPMVSQLHITDIALEDAIESLTDTTPAAR